MNFREFFSLLSALFNKENCEIHPTDTNFSLFLACRYISFISPELCYLINETCNRYNVAQLRESPEEAFKFLRSLLPKMEIGYIEYIKKPLTNLVNGQGISDDILSELSYHMELPKDEILKLIEFCVKRERAAL